MQVHIIIYFIISIREFAAEFVEKPTSVNTTQRSIAEFNCTGYSQGFHWVINNRLPDHGDNSHRGLEEINEEVNSATNLNIHILRVPAKPKNNGVNITCVIYNFQSVPSDFVYLYVQGLFIECNVIIYYLYECLYLLWFSIKSNFILINNVFPKLPSLFPCIIYIVIITCTYLVTFFNLL